MNYLRDSRSALLLLWTLLVLSPTVVHNWVVGTDYIANALYVMLSMLWMGKAVRRSNPHCCSKIASAIFVGVALSSRMNFLLLTPLLFSMMVRNAGWRSALRYSALVGVTFVGVTVPFYLYDPAGFSPLHTRNFLGRLDSVFPFAGASLLFITLALSAILARFQEPRLNVFLGNGAVVLAFPIVWGVTIMSIQRGSLDFEYGFYGVFFLFFWRDGVLEVALRRRCLGGRVHATFAGLTRAPRGLLASDGAPHNLNTVQIMTSRRIRNSRPQRVEAKTRQKARRVESVASASRPRRKRGGPHARTPNGCSARRGQGANEEAPGTYK